MSAEKRTAREAKTGRFIWRAKAVVSDTGSVTVSAAEALKSDTVKSQLDAVKRIREAVISKR